MRQLHVQVPAGASAHVLDAARAQGATVAFVHDSRAIDETPVKVLVVHLPNRGVGPFIDALEHVPELHIAIQPQGIIVLQPPATEVAQQVQDVSQRSPIEIFVAGLQSVGSWTGFLSYAALAGAIVWLGLFTNAVYLLVAAMLIAPFAGPAMNTAIATARGDLALLGRSLLRYLASLSVTTVVAGVLSYLFGQDVITTEMASTANISTAAVVLPIAAGAAGALHLVQGERSSLVSGAATGMLVAASLAPPAGVLGMAVALQEWDLIPSTLFLLGLQLVGINLAGAFTFRLAGLTPHGIRYTRGRAAVGWLSTAVSVAGLVALLSWQLASPAPTLQRSTLQQRAREVVRDAVRTVPDAQLAAVSAEFTRPNIPGQNTLLLRIVIQRDSGAPAAVEALGRLVTSRVQHAVSQQWPAVTPLVDVTVLSTP